MRKKTKLVTLLLVTVLLMSLISACSSSKNEENNASTESPAASSNTATNSGTNDATKDPYEIAVAMPVFGAIPKDMAIVQDEISKITKEKFNATVKFLPISIGAWQQQLNLMTSGGEKLDMYFSFGAGYSSDVALGKVVELDGLLDQYGQGIKEQIDPEYLNGARVNGKIYGIPNVKDFTTGVPGVFMRKDLVEKYNIDVNAIKSLDDLDAVFQTIKDNEPAIAPLGIGVSVPTDNYVWYDKMGDKLGVLPGYDNSLKLENLYETKEYEDVLTKIHSWFKAGYINKDAATSQVTVSDLVKSGKTFAYFVNNKPGSLAGENRLTGRELVYAPLMSNLYSTTSDVMTGLWTISSNSKNPERAMMVMNLMYSDPAIANMLLWGIEGKHYVVNDDKTVDFPSGVDSKTVTYTNQAWLIGNAFLTYPFKTEGPDKWELSKEANANAIKSKALGFSFNSEVVKNEVTAINNVTQQYAKGLESGALDPAEALPEFRSKLKAAGIDKVIAEKQKQLDAWAAANK